MSENEEEKKRKKH